MEKYDVRLSLLRIPPESGGQCKKLTDDLRNSQHSQYHEKTFGDFSYIVKWHPWHSHCSIRILANRTVHSPTEYKNSEDRGV